jgi:hypothetical protein
MQLPPTREELIAAAANKKARELFVHKYRVRKGFGNTSVLQRLITYENGTRIGWADVDYNQAPRALITEIKE